MKTASSSMGRGLSAFVIALLLASTSGAARADHVSHDPGRSRYDAPRAKRALVIDGVGSEPVWRRAVWRPIENRWLGPEYSPEDFEGRFKVVWTPDKLYILVEVVDDILFDSHRDPLVQYWDDDCLEVFLDEDFSGGNHQYDHNAFAYHMSLDNRAIDIGTDRKPREYSHHVESRWRADGNTLTWELAIDVYSDAYVDGSTRNRPVKLSAGKVLGLMLAWCDNDGSELRENFVGSETAPGEHKDRGWIDAGIFGKLVLVP
jgi:hypothetical protein